MATAQKAANGMARASDEILPEHQQEWLRLHYSEGRTLKQIAADFGTEPSLLYTLKFSPAGIAYARTLSFDLRDQINIRAATMLLEVLSTQQNIPVDTLIKLYNATLPKVAPVAFNISAETLRKETESIAEKFNLDDQSRQMLQEFVLRQKEEVTAKNKQAQSAGI